MDHFDILVSSLVNRDNLDRVLNEESDLFDDAAAMKFHGILKAMREEGRPFDLNSICLYLENKGMPNLKTRLIDRYTISAPIHDIGSIIEMLYEQRNRRRITVFLSNIQRDMKAGTFSVEDYVSTTDEFIKSFQPRRNDDCLALSKMATMDPDTIFVRSNYQATGIYQIDNIIRGVFNGQLVTIAARPGIGKSTLAMHMARYFDGPVLFISLEMNRVELFARTLASICDVETWKMESKRMDQTEMNRFFEAREVVKDYNNIILADRVNDFRKIMRLIRDHRQKSSICAVVIDYAQLITGAPGENKNAKVEFITRNLKLFAQEAQIPVILLSQLSRDVEKRGGEPVMSDLRDSGAIEQDSDVVMFLHEKDGETNIIVAKNRKGKTGKDVLLFEKQFLRFGVAPEIRKKKEHDLETKYS